MNRIIILILCVFCQQLFSEEIILKNNTKIIIGKVVSPTKNADARDAYNQGTMLLRQNQFEEAEKYFLKAVEFDNKYVDAIDHLGLTYRFLRRYNDSEKMYLKSIKINPDNLVPYINLAIVYRLQGRLEDARQTYLEAQKIDINDPEPYYGLGVLYQLAGQYKTSIDFINIAIQKYTEKESELVIDAYHIQGINYYNTEEYNEALKYYKIVLLHYPDNNGIKNRINEMENKQNANQ